ncbi:MAG: hypothetical protein OXE03_10215 [Gammaproteobacteria bacterium]|nr:hypothetical protein [Gammaproteobacteria bacterium]
MISLPGLGYKGICKNALRGIFGGARQRRALLIGAGQAVLYHWQDRGAVLHDVFAATEQGRKTFRHYLSQHPDIPFYLLVDLADEEFRQDTVPHVSRRDQRALLKRKVGRLFKDSSYCCHRITGRERTGRRDDRVLLSALAAPGLLGQWVALLDEARAPLAAICSLPLFTARLLPAVAGQTGGRRLLVSLHRSSGLRQTCFDNGEFQFSRLTPLPDAERGLDPAVISAEVDKVRRYLDSRRTDPSAARLDVHLLLTGSLLQQVQGAFTEQESVRYHVFDLHRPAPENAAAEATQSLFSDGYFIWQLLTLRPKNDYADTRQRRWFFLQRLRAGVVAASCALLLGSVCRSALTGYHGLVLQRQVEAARQQAVRHAAAYEQANKRLPQTPVEASELKAAVMTAARLAQQRTPPLRMVSVLSDSLDEFPVIHLHKLGWEAAGHDDIAAQGAPAHAVTPVVAVVTDAPATVYQVAHLHARIEPFNGNLREALALVNRFVAHLRAQAGVREVGILAMPLDVSSAAALQGNTRTRPRQAEFSLKVVLETPLSPGDLSAGRSANET